VAFVHGAEQEIVFAEVQVKVLVAFGATLVGFAVRVTVGTVGTGPPPPPPLVRLIITVADAVTVPLVHVTVSVVEPPEAGYRGSPETTVKGPPDVAIPEGTGPTTGEVSSQEEAFVEAHVYAYVSPLLRVTELGTDVPDALVPLEALTVSVTVGFAGGGGTTGAARLIMTDSETASALTLSVQVIDKVIGAPIDGYKGSPEETVKLPEVAIPDGTGPTTGEVNSQVFELVKFVEFQL
jgi:hypothetical protein